MKTESQLAESIERFRRVFWAKESAGRPPVGLLQPKAWLPVQYLRQAFPREHVVPADVCPANVMTDYEFAFARRPVECDDWMPYTAPWRAVPWLEAWCGCQVRFSSGSLAPEPCLSSVQALATAPLPACEPWFECLRQQTEQLLTNLPEDCWLSPTILRGPSDVLAALRGLTPFLCDLYDAPELVAQAAVRINQLLIRALDQHFAIVPAKLAGYGHIFGYWAPGPTIAIQDDAMGLCDPAVYRDIFMPCSAQVVQHLGACVLFHLHSTGYQHYRYVLDVPGLAGVELTIEANGPALAELVPVCRKILERSRLLLCVDHRYDELADVLPSLPREGLYVVVPETQLRTEAEFCRFVKRIWPSR
jgi:hypothetical protein